MVRPPSQRSRLAVIAAIVLSVVLFMAWAADDALLAVELVAWAAMLFLSLVTFRRAVLTLAAVFGRDKKGRNDAPEPNVLVLIPARDEADVILSCLDSVRRLDWPAEKLRVVVIDDGSGDGTGAVVASESERDARIRVLRRSAPDAGLGKPEALNAALFGDSWGTFIYVLDADAQVRPDTLKRLWAHIDGDDVAAAQGGMIPAGPPESFAAFYVAIESLVHQRITLRGAARIGMTQSLLGSNTLIRRKVLEEAGGFPEKTRLEDIELSIALQNEGRRIAFTPEAHSTIVASPRVKHAMVQHRAWSREFMSIASRWLWRILEGSGSLPRRIDRLIFAMGYADRIVLLVYLLCAIAGGIAGRAFAPWSFIVLVLALPAIQAPLALWLGRGVATEYAYLAFLPVGFAIEMATHLDAFRQALLGRRPEWTRTVRGSSPRD